MLNYKKTIQKIFLFSLLLMGLFVISSKAEAAIVSIKNNSVAVSIGDTTFLSLVINTENKSINVVEGEINFISGSENLQIEDLSVAGSDFTLWPIKPSLSTDGKKISFTAGVPNGVNKSNALLFKIAVKGLKGGQVVMAPSAIKAYINDGRATPVQVKVDPLNFLIEAFKITAPKDELTQIIIGDNKKPQNLTINIGRDQSLFDGKTFIAFSAVDNESGISHYEVKEGNRAPIRSGSIYVLQNQDQLETIVVVAFDKAGNSRKIIMRQKDDRFSRIVWPSIFILVLLVAIVIIVKLFLFLNKRRKNK